MLYTWLVNGFGHNFTGIDLFICNSHANGVLKHPTIICRHTDAKCRFPNVSSGWQNKKQIHQNTNGNKPHSISTPGVYLDHNSLRMMVHYRIAFSILSTALLEKGDYQRAKLVLDRCMEKMPGDTVPYNVGITPLIRGYFAVGDRDTARNMTFEYELILKSELEH